MKRSGNILESEFAGEVEAVGNDVKRFRKGDQVFGYHGQSMGANAEYLYIPEDGMVVLKPAKYEEAASAPYGALTSLSLLRKAKSNVGIKYSSMTLPGVLARRQLYFGAEVTGVCGTPRLEFVKTLGADRVLEYMRKDFTSNGETYDLIFDILGKSSLHVWHLAWLPYIDLINMH